MHEVPSRSHHSRFTLEASSEAAENSSDAVANRSHRDRGDGFGVPRQVSLDESIGAANTKSPLQKPAGIHAFGRDPFVGDSFVGPNDAVPRLGDPPEEVGVAGTCGDEAEVKMRMDLVEDRSLRLHIVGEGKWALGAGRESVLIETAAAGDPRRGAIWVVGNGRAGNDIGLCVALHLEQSVEPMGIRGLIIIDKHNEVGLGLGEGDDSISGMWNSAIRFDLVAQWVSTVNRQQALASRLLRMVVHDQNFDRWRFVREGELVEGANQSKQSFRSTAGDDANGHVHRKGSSSRYGMGR